MRYALLCLLLAACATPEPPERWRKAGSTQAEFDRDQGYCQAQSFQGVGSVMQAAIVFNGCMRGRGWQLTR